MKSESPIISFIIVNWNGGGLLKDCLESIKDQSMQDFEVIVIDNGSSDKSCEIPFFSMANWQLIKLRNNIGFAPANNIALHRCRAPFIALVNNDARLHSNWAMNVATQFERSPGAGSIATKILQTSSPNLLDSAGFNMFTCGSVMGWRGYPAGHFDTLPHHPFGAVASAAAYRKAAINITGFFHDAYFAYYEDTDLAMRLLLFGYPCHYTPDAIAYHLGSVTGIRRSNFHRYHLRRNIEYLYGVNMIGSHWRRHLSSHLTYELGCLCNMAISGQILTFFRAKTDALRMAGWVRAQRRMLYSQLEGQHAITDAYLRLHKSLLPIWQVRHCHHVPPSICLKSSHN